LRLDIIRMITAGLRPSALASAIDILTCLYFARMRHQPEEPTGRSATALFFEGTRRAGGLCCAREMRLFPRRELMTLRQLELPL
jgi:transketolase N-terminal domain/subunit